MARRQINSKIYCVFCNQKCPTGLKLTTHLLSHIKEKGYICNVCGSEFPSNHRLKAHKFCHLKKGIFLCIYCEKSFEHRNNLSVHMKIQHKNNRKQFQCQICKKRFVFQCQLDHHMLRHSTEKTLPCILCNKLFKLKSEVLNHIKSHSVLRDSSSHHCVFCNKKLLNQQNLLLHLRSHTKEKPFSCKLCDTNFSAAFSVKKPMKTAHGDPSENLKFQCSVQQRYQLVVHRKTHFPEEKTKETYNCKICHNKHTTKGALMSHVKRKHSPNARRFNCVFCNANLASSSGFNRHVLLHIKERPVFCKLCGTEYVDRMGCRPHCR